MNFGFSVFELLKGNTLTWYGCIRPWIKSWGDFVACLRRDSLPCDYETDLWNKIGARSQRTHERVSEYFA